MRKIKTLLLLLVVTLSFCIGIDCIKAEDLPQCDFENNYGSFNTVAIKNISTCGVPREKGCDMYGLNEAAVLNYDMTRRSSDSVLWHEDEVSFSYVFAADYGKDGDYVKSAKATLYDDSGKAQCYVEFDQDVLEKNEYELVGWQFKFNKKHVSYVEFSGTYYSNTSDETETYNGSNGYERVEVRKETDGSGVDHTGDGSNTTTTIEEITEGGAAQGTLAADNTKTVTGIGGNSQNACNSINNLFNEYWPYAMIFIPTILIVMIVFDFFKAMISNDDDAIKKTSTSAAKRTICAIIFLALPVLLNYIFELFGMEFCL